MIKTINTKSVINEALNQVKDGINLMKDHSYKLNGLDSFTPTWYQINEIAECFGLFNVGFDLDIFDEFEDAEEARQDWADYYENPDILAFKPSKKDIAQAKKIVNYIDDNFSDVEILDTYHFSTPRPITYKDIMAVYKKFKSAMLKVTVTKSMINTYNHKIKNLSVANWAD